MRGVLHLVWSRVRKKFFLSNRESSIIIEKDNCSLSERENNGGSEK